jgi:hypothetical protein
MFAIAATVLLAIAFVLNGATAHTTSTWFQPTSFLYAGLTCLAAHFIYDYTRNRRP